MQFPFHKYFGPGNDINNGPPIDIDDEIAFRHDLAYEKSKTPEDIKLADLNAIHDFQKNYKETGNWHSRIGEIGLSLKYNIEDTAGVILYPKLLNSEYYKNLNSFQQALFILSRNVPEGIASLTVGHPLDTIKIRSQTMPDSSVIQIVTNTFKLEGLRGFYKGLLAPMLTTGVTTAVYFGVYGNTLGYLNHYFPNEKSQCYNTYFESPFWKSDVFFSGAFAGFCTSTISVPVEAIKTRMQANAALASHKFKLGSECGSTWSTIKFINQKEGIPGFFKGGIALLLRDVPSYGIYMVMYEFVSPTFVKCLNFNPNLGYGLAGGFAGVLGWALVLPFDVIKSSVQSDDLTNPKYKSYMQCFRQNYKQYGISFFFRGFWVTVLRAFPVNYVTFVVYEEFKKQCCS